jgi:hypothetical protein
LVLPTAAAWPGGAAARAQSSADPAAPIQIDARGVPLAEALAEVRAQTGVDLVFARALVEGKRAGIATAGSERFVAVDRRMLRIND